MPATSLKQWRVVGTDSRFDGPKFEDAPIPTLGEWDMLVRIHAVPLKSRDLMIARAG